MRKFQLFMLLLATTMVSAQSSRNAGVRIQENPSQKSVDIYFGDKLFTSYIYPDNIMKPVLWPLISSRGHVVTRSYPLEKVPGERTDHPHHIGLWFNYGDVNGIDYWNNSEAIPQDRKSQYGRISHKKVVSTQSGENSGELVVEAVWHGNGRDELMETTRYRFLNDGATRIIDRETTLKALVDVSMEDNKEGVLGLRVAPEMELPSDEEITLTDAHGLPTTVKASNDRANADYLSSEGITGGDVWGTRAVWMDLHGNMGGDDVHIVIIDHPGNPGYPTYWHARGYGLFAANPLGQSALSGGKESLHFSIKKGEEATFKYRIIIQDGGKSNGKSWNKHARKFAKQ